MSLEPRIMRPAASGRVAVAILTRNSAPFLRRTLEMLCRSTEPRELWVIDSQSDDETARIAEAYGAGLALVDPARFRHGPARNVCMQVTRAEYVVLVSGDAVPTSPDLPEKLASALDRFPDTAGATARAGSPSAPEARRCQARHPHEIEPASRPDRPGA